MRVSINAAILLSVAATGASVSIACEESHCGRSEVVRTEEKSVPTAEVCAAFPTKAFSTPNCERVCGAGFNTCRANSYGQVLGAARQRPADAGAGGSADAGLDENACPPDPASTDGLTKVECQVTEFEPATKDRDDCPVAGRRPANLLPPLHIEDASALGAYFASSAHLEAAAVLAFDHIVVELEAHGAPAELVAAARVAREEEVRHACIVGDLAHRFGATPAEARMHPTPIRGLLDIALENEIEGVVRETFGAAVVTWRATHAGDADVRAAMTVIARDERSHAELSWRIAEWLEPRLTEEQRVVVREARVAAIAELRAVALDPADEVAAIAGVPRAAHVRAMLAELERALWSSDSFARAA